MALVVVLLGRVRVASIGAFHRGWGLLVVTGLSAAVMVGLYSRPVADRLAA